MKIIIERRGVRIGDKETWTVTVPESIEQLILNLLKPKLLVEQEKRDDKGRFPN